MTCLSGLCRLFGAPQTYTPQNHPLDARVLQSYDARPNKADTYERAPRAAATSRLPKRFPGDGSNKAAWMLRAADQQKLQRATDGVTDPERLVALARKAMDTQKKHMMGPAGDVLKRAVEQLERPPEPAVCIDLFDAYDAADTPRRALSVRAKSPEYFTAIGDRAYGRFLRTADVTYYDIAARAHQKAQSMRGAQRPRSPTVTNPTPPPSQVPTRMV